MCKRSRPPDPPPDAAARRIDPHRDLHSVAGEGLEDHRHTARRRRGGDGGTALRGRPRRRRRPNWGRSAPTGRHTPARRRTATPPAVHTVKR